MTSAIVEQCPACGSDGAVQVGNRAEGFDAVIVGRRFQQPAYSVRMCVTCGLYFKTDRLSASDLDDYYAVLDSGTFDLDFDFPTDRVLRARLAALPCGARVLDFGCSTGRILKDFATSLVCVGVEPNAVAAATARSRGIQIISPDALEAADPFDAIILSDVFEHLVEPLPVLRHLASKLVPGGLLAIVTGNADAIVDRTRLAEFWYFRIAEHVCMLSRQHLDWLAATLGLSIEATVLCSHYRVGWRERWRQRAQAFAYASFRDSPGSLVSGVLRRVPRLRNAERWSSAPASNHAADHIVAFLVRPADG